MDRTMSTNRLRASLARQKLQFVVPLTNYCNAVM